MDNNEVFDKNFRLIADEIKRQFEITNHVRDRLDAKSQVLLGFIIVVLGYLIVNEGLINVLCKTESYWVALFFVAGIGLILSSLVCAFFAYKPMGFSVGIEIDKLVEMFSRNGRRDFNKIIARGIHNTTSANTEAVKKKARYTSIAFLLVIAGLLLLFLARYLFIKSGD